MHLVNVSEKPIEFIAVGSQWSAT